MRLIVQKAWQYRDRSRGVCELAAGEYRVPEQVDRRTAGLCVAQGMGRLVKSDIAMADDPAADTPAAPRRGGRRRKGPAPENKIAHAAENKQALF